MKTGCSDVVVLLDRTGSMQLIKSDAIGGYNQFVEDQKNVSGECFFSLVQFDTQDPHEVKYTRVLIQDVSVLTDADYQPRSGTPLYDSMAKTIHWYGSILSALPEEERPETVVFAILTDGQENSSREYTKNAVFSLVQEQQDKWNWKFIYLGANQDAMNEASNLGIKFDPNAQNIATFAATPVGATKAYKIMSRSTTHYRKKSS